MIMMMTIGDLKRFFKMHSLLPLPSKPTLIAAFSDENRAPVDTK